MTRGVAATGITVGFGGATVLDGVDLSADAGAITGVTGPSGSGKTTLLRVLAGLQRPDAGTRALRRKPDAACRVRSHCWPSIRGWCATRAGHCARSSPSPPPSAATPADLADVADRVGLDAALLDRYPGQVSDGQLQRACLGRSLTQRASTVLCDEPTAMLDPIASASVATLLREIAHAGATVVLVSHDPALITALASNPADTLALPRPLG